ncbi:NADPH-dependent F420 reductase [Pseudomonas petrae]|uniref:NADPH-dependent F420 reductase n=1 Tax=Pseudomonas petrae TaxID=2912190 RepID=A0ABS9IB84_9PSED|nr:NADPH-dependent F420 reductase [Pseudomonas petrae]MCF7533705.1 NADPH-dependent F420 reductase [Pseudomonas petrae]MCF7540154.1 NADPH-dependent F420 reductase [Pseudomonas petrae]MCF7544504.1 NADPH-dependent F420 reductase [Pseudomonas petrae]MCF7558440.1 NADPH-dependent F420 reductase [Pseudomonas petrae]
MTYSIIGTGSIGLALAGQFARSRVPVSIANTRGPASITPLVKEFDGTVTPLAMQDALQADVIVLAVPFWSHVDVASAATDWQGKIIIDVTNAYGVPLAELEHLPSSAVVAKAFSGARLVKAFNHLPAGVLAQPPATASGRRVIFLSGDDEGAVSEVAALVTRLGYAPVSLGGLSEGGQLVQARDKQWAPLIFQDLFKREA